MDGLNLANIADPGTLDSLWEDLAPAQLLERDFVRWQDRRTRFLSAVPAQRRFRDSWPIRGFWNSRAVDASLYVAPDIRVAALRGQVMNALEAGMAVPSHLFYITDQGSSRWLALAEDPLFAAYQDSMDLLFRCSDEMAREILHAAPFKDVDIISLGPGDGRKDALLLGSLLRLAPDRGEAFYYPFDISASMIARTLERIGRDATIRQRITQAKAIIADFNSLPVFKPIYQFREGPNLFLLLGNLLGNVSDDFGFLKRLNSRAMLPGDLLLLEVRLLPPVAETVGQDAGARGWLLKSKRFDFVPLELLGVPFEEDLLSYLFEADRGTIRGSQTIVAKYREAVFGGKRFDDVELSYVHRYQEATLIAEIGRSGFDLINQWISPKGQNAWLLLQRPK